MFRRNEPSALASRSNNSIISGSGSPQRSNCGHYEAVTVMAGSEGSPVIELAGDSSPVIGEAQLQELSCLLPVRQPEKPDKAQNATPGFDRGGL
ncbi:hypothetical protein BTVI_141408 [Pitangus sulphuratus]|nr:hypothetical protein BTVI_141408 [Pitangus sulphuratus]